VVGVLYQTLLGELTVLPRPPSWLGRGREGWKEKGRGRREMEGKRGVDGNRSIPILLPHFETWQVIGTL